MKKYLLAAAALAAGIVIAVLVFSQKETTALSITDVAADPSAYSGTIEIVGITAAFAQNDPTLIGVMDVKELQCTTANCNKFLLPVRISGKAPAMGDEVRVTGRFAKEAGGYFFIAETLRTVRNHPLGGKG